MKCKSNQKPLSSNQIVALNPHSALEIWSTIELHSKTLSFIFL